MLFKHSGIYILAKFIPGLMAFAALSLYTHLLTPEEYGLYTLIFTGSVFLSTVIFNWLPAGTLRYWSNKEYKETEFITTLASSYIKIFVVLLLVAIAGVVFYWNKEEAIWIVNTFLLLVSLALFVITQNLFSARIEPNNYAYLTIAYSICALAFGVVFALLGYGASGVVTGIAIGTALPTLFLIRKLWIPLEKKSYNKELFRKIFNYGLPLAAAALIEEATKITDRFMLAGIQGKSQAGLYAVGYDLSGSSIIMIMSALNIAAYPVIIKLLDNDSKEAAMDYFHNYVVLLLGVSIPAVVGLNLVGPDLVYLLIEQQYQASVIFLLPWITTAILLMGLQVFYFDLAFQLGQKTIASVKIAVVIASINIGLNFWLIPKMGIQGAAIATISAFAIGTIVSAIYGRKFFSLPFPFKSFVKIIMATFIMGLCLWWLKDYRGWAWLVIQLSVGMFSYFVMMMVFNILDIRSYVMSYIQKLTSRFSATDQT